MRTKSCTAKAKVVSNERSHRVAVINDPTRRRWMCCLGYSEQVLSSIVLSGACLWFVGGFAEGSVRQ